MSVLDLEQALEALKLTSSSNGPHTSPDAAVRTLALASRGDEQVRQQLADPDVLRALTMLAETGLADDLETASLALRCVGNAAIDNPAARDVLTSLGFPWAIQALSCSDAAMGVLTVKVLFNVCADHAAAQRRCYEDRVHVHLLQWYAAGPGLDEPDRSVYVDLLFWITGHKQEVEPALEKPLPEAVVRGLVRLPHELASADADVEDLVTAVETCLLFLRDPTVQTQAIDYKLAEQVGRIFIDIELVMAEQGAVDDEDTTENLQLLAPLSMSVLWCLSDISANILFFSKYDLEDEWIQALIECVCHLDDQTAQEVDQESPWPLVSMPHGDRIATAACQVIGNLFWATDSEVWLSVALQRGIHSHVLAAMLRSDYVEFLHAACGLLIQISRPSVAAREAIGADPGAQTAIARLCRHEKPEMKQDGMKLLGALGRECPINQAKFGELAREVMMSPAARTPEPHAG